MPGSRRGTAGSTVGWRSYSPPGRSAGCCSRCVPSGGAAAATPSDIAASVHNGRPWRPTHIVSNRNRSVLLGDAGRLRLGAPLVECDTGRVPLPSMYVLGPLLAFGAVLALAGVLRWTFG